MLGNRRRKKGQRKYSLNLKKTRKSSANSRLSEAMISVSELQLMQFQKRSLKKFQASTCFEPRPPRYYQSSYEATCWERTHFRRFFFLVEESSHNIKYNKFNLTCWWKSSKARLTEQKTQTSSNVVGCSFGRSWELYSGKEDGKAFLLDSLLYGASEISKKSFNWIVLHTYLNKWVPQETT